MGGILTSIAQKPHTFVIFQGGPDPVQPPLPSGSANAQEPVKLQHYIIERMCKIRLKCINLLLFSRYLF